MNLARLTHGHTVLEDLAVVTWAVPPAALQDLLPPQVEARRFDLPDAPGVALASLVAYRYRGFRFRGAPFASITATQVHLRAHVRLGGEDGVWFFSTSLDHPLARLPRTLWAMPWHRDAIRDEATWGDDGGLERLEVAVDGEREVEVVLAGRPAEPLSEDVGEALVHPPVGWWHRTRGSRLGCLRVGHTEAVADPVGVHVARCATFEQLGLVEPGALPVSALVAHRAAFEVHTPPRAIRSNASS